VPRSETGVISNNSDAWYKAAESTNVVPLQKQNASGETAPDDKFGGCGHWSCNRRNGGDGRQSCHDAGASRDRRRGGRGVACADVGQHGDRRHDRWPAGSADQCRHQRRRRARFCRGRSPRRNIGRRAGAAGRRTENRADHESVKGKASGALRTVPQVGLASAKPRSLHRRPSSKRARIAHAIAGWPAVDVLQDCLFSRMKPYRSKP
jgi:hypothetical protein